MRDERFVDTEERKWDGEMKLWWTARCWFGVLKSDSRRGAQEIVLCAAINENKAADEERPDNGVYGVERTYTDPRFVMHGHDTHEANLKWYGKSGRLMRKAQFTEHW